jgi:hypothetical protein
MFISSGVSLCKFAPDSANNLYPPGSVGVGVFVGVTVGVDVFVTLGVLVTVGVLV